MTTSNHCKKVILAGNDGCRVLYCEGCNVAEIEVGALSLRLDPHVFKSLNALLSEAAIQIATLNISSGIASQFEGSEKMH